ncbi:DMT family transporter [Derxia gummosa]|uniref:DMT family transporter n=1 Tax=Derxia gummosa DSM 723 TaxID=1121388 RepID=A0A8B6X6B8_9BURK|nr:DMT family transporter [Derxia gummosa]
MWAGVAFALVAGMTWGLVFVGPLLLPDYPPAQQAFGRYLAFGLIALPLGWIDRAGLARLARADWIEALRLAAVGNVAYYLLLASAIRQAGAPLPTMIIGSLPVVLAIAGNLRDHARDGHLPWKKLAPPLAAIAAGIGCVNQAELADAASPLAGDPAGHALGVLLALGAMACWTWYPLRNTDWLRRNPRHGARVWATAQGLATLPLALVGYAALWGWQALTDAAPATLPLGPRPAVFAGLMVAIGLLASWVGTLCWNQASARLPSALAGQLIVFETLSALAYNQALRGGWPAPLALAGVALLVTGVMGATRVKALPPTA